MGEQDRLVRFDSEGGPGGTLLRQDSNESVFFQRQLEHIIPEIFEQEKPKLSFLDMIPIKSDVPMGARSITFRSTTGGGQARFIGPRSGDLPAVNLSAEEETVRYKLIGVAAVYSWDEVQAAMMGNVALEADLLREARRAIEELVNTCAWNGDFDAGILGLARHASILTSAAANAFSGSTTADQAIAVLNAGANAIPNNTAQVESADTLLLPPAAYQFAAQLQRSTASDTSTLNYWLNSNGYVNRAMPVRELSTASILVAGAPSTTTAAYFYRKDPAVLQLPYSGIVQLPVQQSGLNYLVPFVAKVGDLIVRRPRAIHRVTGI